MALIHAQAHSLTRLPLRTWLLASCSALDSWQHRGQCFPRPPPRQRQTQTAVGRTRQSKSPEKDAASKEEKLPQELFPASAPPQRRMLLMLHVT